MPKKDYIADRTFLSKTIPTSRRYSDIGPLVKTGCSQSSLLKSLQTKHVQEKLLEREYFSRIKPLTFAKLLYETHFTHDLNQVESLIKQQVFQPFSLEKEEDPVVTGQPPSLARRTCAVSSSSLSGLPNDHPAVQQRLLQLMNIDRPFQRWNGSISTGYDVTLPYLLLDVREEKEWRKYHLIAALPYPSAYLKRDQFNREIMMYKNKKEKSIILYDQNESIAPLTAQLLVEKGFENIFVLSGGLNVLLPKFQGIATGLLLSPSFSSSSMFPKLSPLLHSCCSTPTPTSSTLDDSVDGYDMEALERCILNAATASVSSRSSSRLSQRTSFSSSSSSSSSTSLSTRGRRR